MNQPTGNTPAQTIITTGDGASVGNDVHIQSGDFVGRDQNVTGDIVTGDKVVHVYSSPASTASSIDTEFLPLLCASIWNNRWFVGTVLLLQSLFSMVFIQYANRFKLSLWGFVIASAFLFLALQTWNTVIRARFFETNRYIVVAIVFTTVLIAVVSQQVLAAIFPPQIDPGKFGIAIATLYDGNTFFISQASRRITDSLENTLNFALRNEKEISADDIGIKRVGVVRNNEEAFAEGKRIGAELILWGEISEQPAYTTVFLQLLETSLLTDNPDFPRTLPLNPQISLQIPIKTTDPQELEKILKPQNLGLAYFSLGILLYEHNQNPEYAAIKFETAKNQFKPFDEIREATRPTIDVATSLDEPARLNLGLVYYYLGKSYQLQGDYSQSQDKLQQATKYIPKDLAVWLGMMYNFRAMGKETEFQKTAQCVIDMAEQINQVKIVSQACPTFTSKQEQASFGQSAINKTIANRFNQALAHEALGQYEQALSLYEAILRPGQNPDFFIAHLSAASVLIKLNRLADAELHYDQAQTLAQGNPAREIAVHMGLASWYESQDKWDGALWEYEQASKLNPELPMPYLGQARIYEEQNLDTLAEQSYVNYIQRVEKTNYNLGSAYHTFARYLYHKKSYEKAIIYYNKALLFVHDKAIVYAHLGQVYGELKEGNKTWQAFSEAIQDPGQNKAYIHDLYGRALVTFGCIDEAIEQFEQAIQHTDDKLATTITQLNLAPQYQAIGEIEKARELYRSIGLVDPNQLPQEQQSALRELQQTAQVQLDILDSAPPSDPPTNRSYSTCVGDSSHATTDRNLGSRFS